MHHAKTELLAAGSDHEVDSLFAPIGELTRRGLAVIYVSHRMAEIFRVAQRVLVLRDGNGVGERVLARLSRLHIVDRAAELALARRQVNDLGIRTPSTELEVSKLSGGNQQKVVLARLLAQDASLLILDEPTRGVDAGAKAEIYAIIDRLVVIQQRRAGGTAVGFPT